jgi:ribosomal protein S18 acetylase RimI-like enzyme
MEAALAGAAAQGAARLLLGVYRGNQRAIAFYGKHGFVEVGVRQFLVGETRYDDVVLARSVESRG